MDRQARLTGAFTLRCPARVRNGHRPNPVRIVEGSCERPGAVAFQLPALDASGSEKRLEVGIDELYEGDYAVQVLFSKGRDEPMACGDVPDDPPDGG
jgi:hypothetical protein